MKNYLNEVFIFIKLFLKLLDFRFLNNMYFEEFLVFEVYFKVFEYELMLMYILC